MSSFIIRQSPVTVNDFENPALARQCFGIPIEVDSMEEDLAKNLPYRELFNSPQCLGLYLSL
jgi:hypothetical protein